MKHRALKYYNVHINHGSVMTLTYFKAGSTQAAYECGKTVKMSLTGNILMETNSWTEYQ